MTKIRTIGVAEQTAFNKVFASRDKRTVAGFNNAVFEKIIKKKEVEWNLYHYNAHILRITCPADKDEGTKVRIMGGYSATDTKLINSLLYLLLLDDEYLAKKMGDKIELIVNTKWE